MKVLIMGAHGNVGEHVMKELQQKGYHSLAVVGKENQIEAIKKRGATEAVVYDEVNLSSLFQGFDAVLYITGVSPKADTDKTVLVDHQSVNQAIREADKQGVRHFVMMSAVRANESTAKGESGNIGDKDSPDELLATANMAYTIIRPAKLNDKPGKGTIKVAETLNVDTEEISREDVAAVLVGSLENEHAYKKTFEISSGDTPIQEALDSL